MVIHLPAALVHWTPAQLAHAFDTHMESFGELHICLNNAGIGERQFFLQDQSNDGTGQWRRVLDVDLTAVVDGTRLAVSV